METISLNGLWKAKIDPENVGMAQKWAERPLDTDMTVSVPGCIQQVKALAPAYPPAQGQQSGYIGTWFAETEFFLSSVDRHAYLRFDGVNPACHLFVNGRYAGSHAHIVCPWETDVTQWVHEGKNRVTVAVTEENRALYSGSAFMGRWSGVYGSVSLTLTGAVRLTDLCLTERGAFGTAANHGDRPFKGTIRVSVEDAEGQTEVSLAAGESGAFFAALDTASVTRWYDDDPRLVDVKFDCGGDVTVLRTGLRTLAAKDGRILLNGRPLFVAGAGEEFVSVQISSRTDEKLIRQRFKAMKDYGFNFARYHTHFPTEEEMAIADEMGVLLDAEFGLVSNFHKMEPIEKAFDMLPEYVRHTRNHPSMMIYCLGNEGSQLMIESETERSRARMGYGIVRANTENQFCITCFGNQGELPEMENDIETPHLWSDNFLVAYDGLSRVPWDVLARTTLGRPCVLHEYGKFGVWPDIRDQRCVNDLGWMKTDFADQAHESLTEKGRGDWETLFVKTSRRLAQIHTRVALEEARRQPCLSGYVLWSFFRELQRNTGLCDDTGTAYDHDPAVFAGGCNADVAILMDRGFQRRALPCHIPQTVTLTLSNFSRAAVEGRLCVRLTDGETVIAEGEEAVRAACGETKPVYSLTFTVPASAHWHKLRLSAALRGGRNAWDFWAFDPIPSADKPLLHIKNEDTLAALREVFPSACTLQDADSILIGCRSWAHPALARTALTLGRVVIADEPDGVVREILGGGGSVILLDSGRFPKRWYNPCAIAQLGARDSGRFYTSFRAGWHAGNLTNVVLENAILGDFPHDGYCDLLYYDMLQGARGLNAAGVSADLSAALEPVIFAAAKVAFTAPRQAAVQDPNAVREQKAGGARTFDWMEQDYLLVSPRLCVTSLRLTRDVAGRSLIGLLVKNMQGSGRAEDG